VLKIKPKHIMKVWL